MRKTNGILISFAALSLTLAFAAGCGDGNTTEPGDQEESYSITVTGGTADKQTAEEGETITLTPNAPAEGQEFANWTVNGETITGNTFEMPAEDVTAVAVFEDIEYTITVTGGTADKQTATKGETITLTPNDPAAGQEFESWTVNGEEIQGNTFEMPAEDVTAVASFGEIDYTITVTGGTADKQTANMGDKITLTPAADPAGKRFDGWMVNGEKIEGNTFDMPAENVTVVAAYLDVYTIIVTGGTADLSGALEGETVTLTPDESAAPEGQKFDHWTVNDEEIEGNTFKMPAGNVTAVAIYTYIDYTVEVEGGTADKQTAHLGDTVTLSADAETDTRKFSHWEVNGEEIEGNTFNMPAEDVTVVAVFVETVRTLGTPDNSERKLIYKEAGVNAIAFDRAAQSMFIEGVTDRVIIWIYDSPEAADPIGHMVLTANEPYDNGTKGMLTTSDGELSQEVNGQPANFYIDVNGDGYNNFFRLLKHELGYAYSDGNTYYFAAQIIAVDEPVTEGDFEITYNDSAISQVGSAGIVKDASVPSGLYTVKVDGGLIDGSLTEVAAGHGNTIILTAEAQDGKLFAGWFLVLDEEGTLSEEPLSANLTYEYKVTGNVTIKAVFSESAEKIKLAIPDNSKSELISRATGGAVELDRAAGKTDTMFDDGVASVIYYIYTSPDAQKEEYVGQFRLHVDLNADMAGGAAFVGWIESVDGAISYNVVRGDIGNYYVETSETSFFYDLIRQVVGYDYSEGQVYYFAAQAIAAEGSVYEDSDVSSIGPAGFARDESKGNERYTVNVTNGTIDGTETQVTAGYGVKVTLRAAEPEEGMVFAYWALFVDGAESAMLSGSAEYEYTVTGNADIRAVYVEEGETIKLAAPDNSGDQMIKFSGATIEYDRQTTGTAFTEGVGAIRFWIYVSTDLENPVAYFDIVYDGGKYWLQNSAGDRMTAYDLGEAGNLYTYDGNAHNFIKAAFKAAAGHDWNADGETYRIACQAISSNPALYTDSEIGAMGSEWGSI